jgi:hypothetical protein
MPRILPELYRENQPGQIHQLIKSRQICDSKSIAGLLTTWNTIKDKLNPKGKIIL